MQTLKRVILTVVVLSVVAVIYVMVQPESPTTPSNIKKMLSNVSPTTRQASTEASDPAGPLKPGEDVWIKVPDEKTGRLAFQMHTARQDPQPDNSVLLTEPVAEFFSDDGVSMVRIAGKTGRAVFPVDFQNPTRAQGAGTAPSRGELYDVTISWFSNGNFNRPTLVCRVNNVAFDNDTFRIATESFTKPDGTVVPADQVPVEVRGDEYDFDGRGLTIRWNDRDRRLQLLEIAHGDSLTVKSEKFLKGLSPDLGETGAKPAAKRPSAPKHRPGDGDAILAADVIAPATQPVAAAAVYRAVFEGGTRITQGDRQVCEADDFSVDFMAPGDEPSPEAAPPAAPKPRKTSSATRPTATSTPTEKLEPMIVRWPGRLVVAPIEQQAPSLQPGQWLANLSSKDRPIVINHEVVGEIRCASLSVNPQLASIRNSPVVPVITIKLPDGQILYTEDFRYSEAGAEAVASGQSRIELLVKDEQSGSSNLATAKWSRRGVIKVHRDMRGHTTIESATLSGDVGVEHPQFRLNSDELTAGLATLRQGSRTTMGIRSFLASGNARCEMFDKQKSAGRMQADRLAGAFDESDSRLTLKQVTADGNIHATLEDGEVQAGHIVADIAPTTRPSDHLQIDKLVAQQDVRFKSKEFAGSANQLTAGKRDDGYEVVLQGQPSAAVGTAEGMLHGPIIKLDTIRQTAQVVGAGSLSGARAMSPEATPTPYEMTWREQFLMDGAKNHGEISGAVTLRLRAEDGSDCTATGEQLLIKMVDAPKPNKSPTTTPAGGLFGDMGGMSSKTFEQITLAGGTELKSILADNAGTLLRRAHMFAPKIVIDTKANQVSIPSAGRLLYEDLQARARPTTAPTTPLGDFTGATAFEWKDKLTFDQASNRVDMLGEVVIVHQQDAQKSDPFRLEAPRVYAEFERDTSATSRPANGALVPMASAAKVKSLVAEGGARFVSPKIQFEADRMTYDPIREILAAVGSERAPVQLYDEKGMPAGTVQEAWWNTRTQSMGLRDVQGQFRR